MNEELYKQALEAIQALFSDTSISQMETKQNMEGLIDEIQVLIDSLDEI